MKCALFSTLIFLVAFFFSCVDDKPISYNAQLKKDTTSISQFLASNGIEATKIKDGIWFIIDSTSLGVYPVPSDSLNVSFTAQLIPSLSEVDSVSNQHEMLSTLIAGWQLGLERFPSGSKGRLFIPSGLAFGAIPFRGIPANANLIYNVKSFKVISQTNDHLALDKQRIQTYINSIADSLTAKNIKVINDGSDIQYAIIDSTALVGNKPTLTDSIQVTYNVRILGADTTFYNTTKNLALKDQVTAWKIVLPKIKQGYHFAIFVPSGYGYGNVVTTVGGVNIPVNSNLQYEIILSKVF